MIRLDAILLTSLPQRSKADGAEPYAARVNCVLHSGPLLNSQQLTASLDGTMLEGVREGEQFVFSWQLVQPCEMVRIALLSQGKQVRYWQGCWNGRSAIVHTGTLPVHIFFDGRAQLETMLLHPSDMLATNGLAASQSENHQQGSGESVSEPKVTVEQTSDEELKSEAEEENLDEQENGWERSNNAELDRETEGRNKEQSTDGEHNLIETTANGEMAAEITEGAASSRVEEQQGEKPKQLIAFHTSVLQDLQDLVAAMPTKTLIVDVRPKERRRSQRSDDLSKSRLQQTFGAKYWDRSWAMVFRSQSVPVDEESKNFTFRYSIEEVENHPGGIISMAQKLQEGYTLIVIDSIANYEQSRRRAVIDELQQRVPGVICTLLS